MMDQAEDPEIDAVVQTAVMRTFRRVRATLGNGDGKDPDPLDTLTVLIWRERAGAHRPSGPRETIRQEWPHWGAGAAGGAVLISLFEALGRIFGN